MFALKMNFFYGIVMVSNLMGSEKSPKVVVIGGVIAGLTAAYRLNEAGMNIDLYEARDRVGGRIFTAKINDSKAELGGQNISYD